MSQKVDMFISPCCYDQPEARFESQRYFYRHLTLDSQGDVNEEVWRLPGTGKGMWPFEVGWSAPTDVVYRELTGKRRRWDDFGNFPLKSRGYYHVRLDYRMRPYAQGAEVGFQEPIWNFPRWKHPEAAFSGVGGHVAWLNSATQPESWNSRASPSSGVDWLFEWDDCGETARFHLMQLGDVRSGPSDPVAARTDAYWVPPDPWPPFPTRGE